MLQTQSYHLADSHSTCSVSSFDGNPLSGRSSLCETSAPEQTFHIVRKSKRQAIKSCRNIPKPSFTSLPSTLQLKSHVEPFESKAFFTKFECESANCFDDLLEIYEAQENSLQRHEEHSKFLTEKQELLEESIQSLNLCRGLSEDPDTIMSLLDPQSESESSEAPSNQTDPIQLPSPELTESKSVSGRQDFSKRQDVLGKTMVRSLKRYFLD
jgi:hypothetical protein